MKSIKIGNFESWRLSWSDVMKEFGDMVQFWLSNGWVIQPCDKGVSLAKVTLVNLENDVVKTIELNSTRINRHGDESLSREETVAGIAIVDTTDNLIFEKKLFISVNANSFIFDFDIRDSSVIFVTAQKHIAEEIINIRKERADRKLKAVNSRVISDEKLDIDLYKDFRHIVDYARNQYGFSNVAIKNLEVRKKTLFNKMPVYYLFNRENRNKHEINVWVRYARLNNSRYSLFNKSKSKVDHYTFER